MHPLRKSEERYRTLFENVPVGLYRTDEDRRIIEANPALANILVFCDRISGEALMTRVVKQDTLSYTGSTFLGAGNLRRGLFCGKGVML
ncbi:MAG: PAS domain-containing protein [Thermodesulfobacteriota bacterium]